MKEINVLALAYLGDAIYEVYIREYLVKKGICNVNTLQKEAVKYVSAKNQSIILNKLILDQILTDDEMSIVYRGRNHKSHKAPKNTDIKTYKEATGFETLIGYLSINNKNGRIDDIMNYILED